MRETLAALRNVLRTIIIKNVRLAEIFDINWPVAF